MGKVKHTKQRHDPYLGGNGNKNAGQTQTKFSDVISDLSSLDASKRVKACSTLAGVYYFNVSNKSNLDTLTTSNILGLLSMRLADSSKDVRKEAAVALHNLSECNESDVFARIINAGLFQRALASVVESDGITIDNGSYVEQLLFSISNTVVNYPRALQELARVGPTFIDFVVSLLNTSAPHNCITAAAQLLSTLTNVKANPNASSVVNIESLSQRVWSFSRDLNFTSSGNSTSLILVQCSEILCNCYLQCDLNQEQLVAGCHLSEVIPYLVQLLGTIPASQSSEGSEGVGGLTIIKVVANTLLSLMEPFRGSNQEEQEEVTSVDIEEARNSVIPSLSESARRKYQTISEQLDSRVVVSAYMGALNRVTESVKSAVHESLVVTSSEGNNGGSQSSEGPEQQSTPMADDSASTTSVVITKQVLNAVDCLEQLLTSLEHYTLFKASCGEFFVEVDSLLDLGQYLQELVNYVTTPAAPASTGSSASSSNGVQQLPWSYAEDVSESAVKEAIISSSASLFDYIAQLMRLSHNTSSSGAGPSLYLCWSEASLKALTLLLIRASSSPLSEVALSAVILIAAIGQQGESSLGGNGSTALRLSMPLSFHTLLTNALLRRLLEPNCYAHSSTVKGTLNVHQNTLLLMDAMFNAVIDLHSSDDASLLEQFKKLNCIQKLKEASKVFQSKMRHELSRKMDEEERDKLEETLENVRNFIEYKSG